MAVSVVQAAEPHPAPPPANASGGGRPTVHANVVEFFVEKPDSYATGSLHIIYSDGAQVVEVLPPEDARKGDAENQVGISSVQLAGDQKTVGWAQTYFIGGQSYPIPLVLTLYRSGSIIRRIRQGQMIWGWSFLDGAQKAAIVWGLTHGPEVGDYQLYDVNTGRKLAEAYGDEATQQL